MALARIPRKASSPPKRRTRRSISKNLVIPPMPKGPTKGLLTRLEAIDITQEVYLPPKEEKFARLYIKQLNATQAYIMAGFMAAKKTTAAVMAQKLLIKANIQIRLAQLWDKEKKSLDMSTEDVIQMYVKAAKVKMSDFYEDDGKGVPQLKNLKDIPSELLEGLETSYDSDGNPKVKMKLVSKTRVYEMLGKVHKLFGDTSFIQNNLTQKVQIFTIGNQKVEF